MTRLWLLVVIMLKYISTEVDAVAANQFYPFGSLRGDEILEPGDDLSSNEIRLDETIVYFDTSFRAIYVNLNGHVSFDSEVPAYGSNLVLPLGFHIIAVFFADIDTRTSGRVYYRSTSEVALTQRAAMDIRPNFSGFENFLPSSLFIVTWDRVGYYSKQGDKTNTFQLVLASDGQNSFAIFHYLDNGIQWLESHGKSFPPYADVPPQAGFDGGEEGMHYTLPGSAQNAAFVNGSNVNIPGVWMHLIGNTGGGNIKSADLKVEVTLFEVDTVQDSCFLGSTVCHANAHCIDYDRGPCCACVPPFYGNGLNCLEPGKPHQLNGRVYGNLNGVSLDNNMLMHSYVVTTEGRTYNVISGVPANLGPAMQTLNSVGGTIGWLFASSDNPRASNGYSLTGGVLNRTARVTFLSPEGGENIVKIQQFFSGHDSVNGIRMETRLEGNMPDILLGATVSVDDYSENYKKVALGTIKSFVARTFRVNNVLYNYTWDNTITFEECKHSPQITSNEIMSLSVNKQYVKHIERDRVVKFSMSSKTGILAGSDPCTETAQTCDQNADCVPHRDSYMCVCRPGYNGNGETCEADSRYCGQHICDVNAHCILTEDRFQSRCECKPGFRKDGNRCIAVGVLCNGKEICAENAKCVFDEILRRESCQCMDEFSGDGPTLCEPTLNTCGECDSNAQCLPNIAMNTMSCQCDSGYTGDGKYCTLIDKCVKCDRNARCDFDNDTSGYKCICKRGYQGDGNTCQLLDCREDPGMCDPKGGICWTNPIGGLGRCRCNHGYRDKCVKCDRNARCDFDNDTSGYKCICKRGYQGDGNTCQLLDCREDPFVAFFGDGFNCQPIGCDVHYCDTNANCVPDGSSYTCLCKEGFVEDGKRCKPKSHDFVENSQASRSGCIVFNDCDANARCIPDTYNPNEYMCRCNPGFQGDGKVCLRISVPCNQVNNCDRDAECVLDADTRSYTCRCVRGYEGDGLSCVKKEIIDCRRNPGICSNNAECVQGVEDVYVCVCKPGFRGDGAVCSSVVHEGNYLIYAQGNKVMRVPSDPRPGDYGQQLVFIPGMLAVGVDIDCQEGDVYWTDAAMGVLRHAKLNGSDVETALTGLKSPEGIAIDFLARNMFFTDSGLDTLQVAKLDGSAVKTLVDTDMVNPRAIALDINRGVIYWTDWNRNRPQIERINMDGTQRKVVVSDGLRLPNGLLFDTFSQTLCWGDAGTKSIDCIRSDGEGRRVVYDKATYPFDITVLNNIIYWTDWNRQDIPNINQNGGEPNQALKKVIGGNGRLYGITAVKDHCPRVRSPCGLNNGGCKYFCLASAHSGRTCACPDGMDPRICQQ